ncbi:two-component system response regulator [Synechococcus sp. PCC 7336]|uniref:two-component system response regulator n=1 Tax=Synechococcus sp. PCC 7336 TaxID=195250 RepID=UPI0012E9D70E|nr:two-component system response regulator [Synechococcus sp. PCC 7336]
MASDWEVLSANSIDEGVEIAERAELDAILLDGDRGEEDLLRVLTHPSTENLPVIAIVEGRPADWSSSSLRNVAAVISKASNPLSLAEQIARALHWPMPDFNN